VVPTPSAPMRYAPLLLLAPVLALLAGWSPLDRAPREDRVRINDNRSAAGVLRGGDLTLRLEARVGEWRPDGDDRKGALIQAFAEPGKRPSIPGPMIRVRAGTRVTVTIRNSLPDSTLIVHGLHDRPLTGAADSIEIRPGETREVRFRLDAPGSYYYWATSTHRPFSHRTRDDSQLGGAIIVDGPGDSPARDRVLVIGLWADTVGGAPHQPGDRALLVINGRSWPATERLRYQAGDTIRWRVINASSDIHPMHLHGFYFQVNRRGDAKVDTAYAESRRRLVFTEFMRRGGTMSISWVPERPGNWLFHCHIPDHFDHRGPLGVIVPREHASAGVAGPINHAREGMSGLVMGVHVSARRGVSESANGAARQAERTMRLLVRPNPAGTSAAPAYAFTLHEGGAEPAVDTAARAGPVILLQRGQPVSITVVNRLTEPTAVHWHGIELESYFDGVAGFSGLGRQITPAIAPGDSFVARFTPPRSGTFIYHTHVAEPRQLRGGLGGALIVVDSVGRYDANVDRPMLLSTPRDAAASTTTLLNGEARPSPLRLHVGETRRFRFINITTNRPGARLELRRDTVVAEWRVVAKDGVDLPPDGRQRRRAQLPISIGETYDIELAPEEPGDLRVEFRASNGAVLMRLPIEVLP
jgi:FtsP/CotA-like multicopper oxidase with cupredoxin domain